MVASGQTGICKVCYY